MLTIMYSEIKYQLRSITNLSTEERFMLESILHIITMIDNLKKNAIDFVNEEKFIKAQDSVKELKYWEHCQLLQQMKEQFFNIAGVETLSNIVDGKPFTNVHSFLDPIVIDKRVLRDFRYSSEWKNDAKAHIAKKLGAKIVV